MRIAQRLLTTFTYNADEILVLHLLDGDVMHETRYYSSRAFRLAEVDLLTYIVRNRWPTWMNIYLPRHRDHQHLGAS